MQKLIGYLKHILYSNNSLIFSTELDVRNLTSTILLLDINDLLWYFCHPNIISPQK